MRKNLFLLLICLSITVLNFAQTIKGKVLDASTGEPLVGATVKLNGSEKTLAVRLDGSYVLKNLAAGTYKITASYAGYTNATAQTVSISGKETQTVNFNLESTSSELSSVTITAGGAGTDKGARRLEKLADPLLNILSNKTIQLLPDITVANALQRVSGVTIEKSGSGEARYPIIRGMEKRYINTLVNGIKIPSPDNKNRFVPHPSNRRNKMLMKTSSIANIADVNTQKD